jgi:hypothetical protein
MTLHQLIAERLRAPFAWGLHDCCLWAADAVLVQTGVDHAAPWRGTYRNARGAARVVRELGGMETIGAMAGELIRPLQAALGDVGLLHRGDRDMLGVCAGQEWLVPSDHGLVPLRLEEAAMAWRVGLGDPGCHQLRQRQGRAAQGPQQGPRRLQRQPARPLPNDAQHR